MTTYSKMLLDLEQEVKDNPSLSAIRWWKKIMNPKYKDYGIVQKFVVDVCKRDPQVILAIKRALIFEIDEMVAGKPAPEIDVD